MTPWVVLIIPRLIPHSCKKGKVRDKGHVNRRDVEFFVKDGVKKRREELDFPWMFNLQNCNNRQTTIGLLVTFNSFIKT